MGTDRRAKPDRGAGIKSEDRGERFTAMPAGIKSEDRPEGGNKIRGQRRPFESLKVSGFMRESRIKLHFYKFYSV